MKGIYLFFLVMCITKIYAQTADSTAKIPGNTGSITLMSGDAGPTVPPEGTTISYAIPPSADAASLGKYGDLPVSTYTGVPDISIPLYTIKSGDLILPISISYHSGGNKVEEMASSVGLGWAFNAGGSIVRTISRSIIPYHKPGKRLYFDRHDLEEWIRRGRKNNKLTAPELSQIPLRPARRRH